MKLLRHLTAAGPAYAALQPDGTARKITGDPLVETHRVTDRVVIPGKLLAPVNPVTIIGIGLNYAKHAAARPPRLVREASRQRAKPR